MTITWELKKAYPYKVVYGKDPQKLDCQIDAMWTRKPRDDRYFHYTVTLADLEPETRYFYRIQDFQKTPTSFRTAPLSTDQPFTFIVYGDSREAKKAKNNQHYQLVEQIKRMTSDSELAFVINTGDLTKSHTFIDGWNLHFDAIRHLADRVPYIVASGNHEWNPEGGDQVAQPSNWIHEFPHRDLPDEAIGGLKETSFAFGYGSSYFIFLGYPHAGNDSINAWLRQQLTIGKRSYKMTFVTFHVPPFDRRTDGYQDFVPILSQQAKLFHTHEVDAVLSGHNHLLALHEIHWNPTGDAPNARVIPYIITGGGGANLRDAHFGTWKNRHGHGFYGKTKFAKRVYHFYKVKVDGAAKTATFTAYDIDGNVVHKPFTLHAQIKK